MAAVHNELQCVYMPQALLTVNFRQPSQEFTFNVGIDLLF
jgi:hypothetical protein